MVAEPTATDVINPELETVAIAVLLDNQESVLFAALEGDTVVIICCVCETVIETVVWLTAILETRTGATAVARYVAKLEPLMDPRPVQLSYPDPAEYPPLDPVIIS